MHAHRFFTFLYCAAGEGTIQLMNETVVVKAGDVLLSLPGEPHDTSQHPYAGWVVEFTADALGDSTRSGFDLPPAPWTVGLCRKRGDL
jgi:quercetin dioxygenase-like cupin family protein